MGRINRKREKAGGQTRNLHFPFDVRLPRGEKERERKESENKRILSSTSQRGGAKEGISGTGGATAADMQTQVADHIKKKKMEKFRKGT